MINYLQTHWRLAICILLAVVVYCYRAFVCPHARNDTLGGSMVYAYWHPDGRYCAAFSHDGKRLLDSYNTPMFKNKLTNKKI
jgi:hypothetical protein